jgi:hypothetical protein
MALQYINVSEIDFGRGIDARSAENQIGEGFVKDLLNADVIQKSIHKRTGYQSYAGNIPVRVTRLDYITVNSLRKVHLTLDQSITLENIKPSPLYIYGKSSNLISGPFTNAGNSSQFYKSFTVPYRKTLTSTGAPPDTYTIPGNEHGIGTTNFFCNIVECPQSTNSYSQIIPDSLAINTNNYNVDIKYSLSPPGTTIDVIVSYLKLDTDIGKSYISPVWNHTGSGSETLIIGPSTHDLSLTSGNILYKVYQVVGSTWQEIKLDSLILEFGNTGVTVRATIDSPTAAQYYVLLTASSPSNVMDGAIEASAVNKKIVLDNITNPWIFYNLYRKLNATQYEHIEPDTVQFNNSTRQLTITLDTELDVSYRFIYEPGKILSNVIEVPTDLATSLGTDYSPQITIWGLSHSEIYAERVAREGWTTHLDTYRRSGERKVIAGLGGNLFVAREGTEFDATSQNQYKSEYDYPTVYPSLRNISSITRQRVGRLFYDTGDTPNRSRGYITTDGGGTGWASVTSVQYDPANSWTKYTLEVPNMNIIGTLSTMISTTAGLEDWLTVNNMSYKRHEGTFRIRDVDDTIPNKLIISVENSDNNSTDWNDLNTGGLAGVFTDRVNWAASSLSTTYLPGDKLYIFEEEFAEVYSSDSFSNYSICGPFEYVVDILENTQFTGARTSSIIPLRIIETNIPGTVQYIVRGDMLSYTGINRKLQVLSANLDISRYVSVSPNIDGITATITYSGVIAITTISSGQKILITGAGDHSGVKEVDTILSSTQFTIKSSGQDVVTNTAIFVGDTIEIDEELTWRDSLNSTTTLEVQQRWIPIEAPEDTDDLTPPTYVRHLDSELYWNQPFLRSTMVSDSLYLTNGSDEVMKFDGQNIYRAGLPAWQPGLFVTLDTAATAKVVIPKLRTCSYTALSVANKNRGEITLNADDMYTFPVGTQVIIDGDPVPYTVRGYEDKGSGGTHVVLLDRALSAIITAAGTITEVGGIYKYYFRLNAIDANDNIIASAMTSSDDMSVRMTADAAINIKLVGMPALDNYNYSRIEIEIYRTKLLTGAVAPVFYKVVTLGNTSTPSVNFDNTTGYLQYVDTAADADLTQLDLVSSIAGAELGIGWSDPLRARYITSADNRLVLGNVRDYPEFDIQIDGQTNLAASVFAGDTLLFRKDSEDTDTDTNMIDRVKFEWKDAFSGTVNSFGIGSNEFSFVTSVATGAAVGDWIYLTYNTVLTSARDTTYSGWWQIKQISGTSISVQLMGASAAVSYPNRYVIATDPTNVPVYLGTDGNLGQTSGDDQGSTTEVFDATRRLALALNSVMRQVDTGITSMNTFRPWLIARSGNDVTRAGRIVVRAPYGSELIPSVVPTFSGYSLYVNSLPVGTGDNVEAAERVYPSRILVSYPNYPEIFDSPTATLDSDSLSAIDVNPADGQEITGIIPFFGEAAFTAAQQAGILVVFKTNSIYLVDINQKVSGSNLVIQRLETQGLGCTAPYSIASTKNGIMFANNSGMYCLRRNQAIEYIGKFMERNWGNKVEKETLSIAQGHHYNIGRMYKLSVPIVDTQNETTGYIEPSQVYVYNHTQEDEEQRLGAWSRYDNHNAIGWANLASDAFWASTKGQVYILRTTGTETDYRDSNQPIVFRLDTRPNSYGNSGIRKILDKVVASYRAGSATTSNNLYFSADLEQEYSITSPFRIAGTSENLNNFSDLVQKDIITLRHSLDRRKGIYFSIRIENSNLDENVEVAGLDYRIGGLDSKGIKSADKT